MKIDISKFNIPSKEIKVPLFEEEVTIYPITGLGLLKIKKLSEAFEKDVENEEAQRAALTIVLKYGCKCNDEEIAFLIDNAYISCLEILKQVLDFSTEYAQTVLKEENIAKKKLKK